MKLGSLIQKEYIITGDRFSTPMEAVGALIELFGKREKFPVSSRRILEIVQEREALGGTLLPPGIAIPHGRLENYEDILIGMWVPSRPLETEQGELKILIFFLTSKAGSSLYLPVLSSLGTYFNDGEFLDSLMGKSPAEIHEILKGMEIRKEVTVGDILEDEFVTCRKDDTLAQLADLFYRKKVSFIPVVDDEGRQIGEVTIKDLLSKGVPDYAKRLGNVSFMRTLEPFEALLREEDRIPVEDIMRPPTRKISRDASIIEAVMLIITKGVRHIPVVDGDKVVGMLNESSILKKVIRA